MHIFAVKTQIMDNKIHIGNKIAELLQAKHITKRELGGRIGMSPSSAVYLTNRKSIDAETLWKIGIALKYNFFKHYPIEEEGKEVIGKKENENDEAKRLKEKIAELEKQLEASKRDLVMQKQENVYLKKINDLLEKK